MKKINGLNIRCDFDDRDEKIGKKIRLSEVEWIPYAIIIGPKEIETKTVSVRKRLIGEPLVEGKTNERINEISLKEFTKIIDRDLKGFPRRPLPIPFRYISKRISFRQ